MSHLAFPEIFESLLQSRGIALEDKDSFLNPAYEKLHDPMLLPDMERARDRVIEAMKDDEHIVVFSDYDADGIPGAVVLADLFRRADYKNVSFYIPHRHDEGFGLNLEAMDECKERGAKLIITVDCGVADIKEVARANELGMEVIITDHHEPNEELPPAYAIVDPKLKNSTYPFKEICGSAVAFKLVQAILAQESFGIKPGMEKWSLDMVGIATLSDMVPLIGENRILARFGLDVLRKSPRPGISALFNKLKLDQKTLSEDDITFMITPRINAASRMGVPYDAFLLLSTTSQVEADRLAAHLEKINNERKGLVASMVKEAKSHLEKRESIGKVIVIGNPEWKPSLAGLVCNSLTEEYERPVFVWGRDGAGHYHGKEQMVLKGSCRSYKGYDLFKLMESVRDSFLEFGGHAGAGGFSISLENVTHLEENLSKALENLSFELEKEIPGVPIAITDINERLWKTVSQFAPFGIGNEKPVFKITNAPVRTLRQFGKENNHLEITLGNGVKAISFFSTPESYKIVGDIPTCNLYANLEMSYFRNRPELRLRIVNIET